MAHAEPWSTAVASRRTADEPSVAPHAVFEAIWRVVADWSGDALSLDGANTRARAVAVNGEAISILDDACTLEALSSPHRAVNVADCYLVAFCAGSRRPTIDSVAVAHITHGDLHDGVSGLKADVAVQSVGVER